MSRGTVIACTIAICAIFLFSRHVQAACEERLGVFGGGWSEHLISDEYNHEEEWNEEHRAVGAYCNNWGVARFKNSLGETAVGVGRDFVLRRTQSADLGVYVAAWSGYKEIVGLDVIPVASPYAEAKVGRLDVRLLVNPVVVVGIVGWRF